MAGVHNRPGPGFSEVVALKYVLKLNLFLLTVLCLSTGLVKVFGMKEEVELFARVGITHGLFVAFGVAQLLAGVALIFPRTRRYGAAAIIPTFFIATYALFVSHVQPFGYLSFLFIAMALVPLLSGAKPVPVQSPVTG